MCAVAVTEAIVRAQVNGVYERDVISVALDLEDVTEDGIAIRSGSTVAIAPDHGTKVIYKATIGKFSAKSSEIKLVKPVSDAATD